MANNQSDNTAAAPRTYGANYDPYKRVAELESLLRKLERVYHAGMGEPQADTITQAFQDDARYRSLEARIAKLEQEPQELRKAALRLVEEVGKANHWLRQTEAYKNLTKLVWI